MADPKARIVLSAEDRTKPAFASAMRNMQALETVSKSVSGGLDGMLAPLRSLGALAAATGLAVAAISFKNTVDTADELGKLAQRSGIAVENLSALRFAGALADVTLEELGDSVKKLNVNIAAAARGEKAQADAFKAIGVAVKDANGHVRTADDVLGDVADRFQGYGDGANKVAIANAIGGKSFEKLIPLLNGGREGLKAAREELQKYGGVITQEMAERAERFNDSITRLGFAAEGLKIQALGGFIDKLAQLAEALARFAGDKNVSGGLDVLARLQSLQPPNLMDAGGRLAQALGFGDKSTEELERNVARARAALDAFEKSRAGHPAESDPPVIRDRRAGLQENLERAKTELNAKRVGGGRGLVNPALVTPAEDKKPDAPALPPSGNDAEAAANKALEGQLKAREDQLASFRDIEEAHQRFVKGLYDEGLVSLDAYYEHQQRSRQTALEKARQTFAAEEALLVAHLKTQEKPQDQQDTKNKIAEVQRKRAAAEREAAQAGDKAGQDRVRDAKTLALQVKQLDAQLEALRGNPTPTANVEIDRQVEGAQETLTRSNGDPAKAEQLRTLLQLQEQFKQTRTDFTRVTESAAIAEERLVIASENNGAGLLETEGKVRTLRSQQLEQLALLIQRTERIADATKDPAILQSLEEMRLAYDRINATVDPTKLRLDAAAGDVAHTLTDGLHDAFIEGKKLSEVLEQIGKRIQSIVFDELVSKPLEQELRAVLKGGISAGGGFRLPGTLPQGARAATPAVPSADEQAQQTAQESFRGLELQSQQAAESLAAMATETSTTSTVLSILPSVGATPATSSLAALNAAGATPATSALAAFTAAVAAATAALQAMAVSSTASGASSTVNVAAMLAANGGSALVFHEGGVVGQGGEVRATDFSDWSQAIRYHTGGVAGRKPDPAPAVALKPGEERVVLQAGEELVDPSDPRHRSNTSADTADKVAGALQRMASSSVVQPLAAPIEGLARDEVPAILKRGVEVLTADDPRHSKAARGLQGIAGDGAAAAGAPGAAPRKTALELVANLQDAILPKGLDEARPQGTLAALLADERHAVLKVGEEVLTEDDPRHRDNLAAQWQGVRKYHTGGIVGAAADASPIATTADAAMSAGVRTGDTYQRGGDTHVHVAVAPPAGASRQTMQQWGTDAGRQIERAIRRNG